MRTRPGWTPGTAPSALITWDPLREDVDRVWGSLASAPPATALVDPEGEFLRLNLAFVELTGHSEAELRALGFAALLHRAARDPLTGLPTRALFLDRLDAVLARLERHPGLVAVLVMDLDRFAQAAERVGVDAADGVLVAVAGRLRGVLRPSDTVGRLGSDEFAVLCQDLRDGRDAVRLAERIASGLDTPFAVGGTELTLDASVGIALTGSHRRRAGHLLRDAETAMHRAKRQEGTSYELYDEAVRARLTERLRTEAALRAALDRGELRVAYQPIVALREGRVVAVERLAALGVGLAVDDFGTGCSSLASLRQLPLSALKIDRSFVAGLDREPPDDAVATAVIGLAHSLGLAVVAEGVETRRQLARLDELGCDQAQGHLFAAPEPGGRLGELLGQDRAWQ